jgi:hypothetical protein
MYAPGSVHVDKYFTVRLLSSLMAEGYEQQLYRRSIRTGFPGNRGSSRMCSVASTPRPCPDWLVLALPISRFGRTLGMPLPLLSTRAGLGSIDGLGSVGARSSTFRIAANGGIAERSGVSNGVLVSSSSCPSGSCSYSSSSSSVSCASSSPGVVPILALPYSFDTVRPPQANGCTLCVQPS